MVHYEDLIKDSSHIRDLADWLGVREHTFDNINDYKTVPKQTHMVNLNRKGFEDISDNGYITEQEKFFIGCLNDGLIKHYGLENRKIIPSRLWIKQSLIIEWLNKALIRYPLRVIRHGR